MSDLWLMPLREAMNVGELKARDRIVRKLTTMRKQLIIDRETYQRWNRAHPNEAPLSTEFEDAMIEYLDGEAPMPQKLMLKVMEDAREIRAGRSSHSPSGGTTP
jgi:hypothetical protein